MPSADVGAAQALADVGAIAILQQRATLEAQVVNQLRQHALNGRIVIEQARKGRLRYGPGVHGLAQPCPQPQPSPRRPR
ncbi:MAG: hypothetical protein ACLQVK_24705 [Acidimicrobiales bacterium]